MVWPTLGSRKAKEQNRTEQIPKDEGLSFLPSWGKVRCICLCLSKNVPIFIVVLTYLDKSLNDHAWLKVNNDSLVDMGICEHIEPCYKLTTVICTAMDVHCRYVVCYNYNVYRADRQ